MNLHEAAQRRREAAMPLWARLQWLEEASQLAVRLAAAPAVPAPAWARALRAEPHAGGTRTEEPDECAGRR